jgi:hypothetical protein
MPKRLGLPFLVLVVLLVSFSTLLLAQQSKPNPGGRSVPAVTPEFPVILQESITAGKTPVGTKVLAKLTIATLVNGVVVPKNAIFSGEVIESMGKTSTNPSRLTIRMDSLQWKNGTTAVRAYLNGWYYPTVEEAGQDLQYGPTQPANRTWNGQGQYPDQNSKVYRPFPSGDSDNSSAVPDTPSTATSKNRLLMKQVEPVQAADGTISLTSKHSNLKLDKYTTYVLTSAEPAPAPQK